MKIKKQSILTWNEAPDIITPEDLSKITGLGLQACRKLFDTPSFPSISKKIVGNISKADKAAVRLYLQGFDIKSKDKNALLMLIYQELQKINKLNSKEITEDDYEMDEY